MREMKDSGIEWIGEIPDNWGIRRIKYVAEFEPKCNMDELKDNSIITYLPMECLKNGYFEKRELSLRDVPASLTRFQENDIVMAKVTPCFENGNIAIMQNLQSGFGVGSSELFVLRCKKVNIHYLYWWLQNMGFVSQACSTMTGTGGLKRISPHFVRNCAMHIPPETEQIYISNFLKVQCAELDNIIVKTRASIEEYKKLKQAVITQAITKGVRGDREMKDSGSVWFGSIPLEWDMKRIKYLFKIKKNIAGEEGHTVLSITQRGIIPKDISKNEGQLAESYANYQIVDPGDFAMNHMDLLTGWVDVSKYSGVTSPDYRVFSLIYENNHRQYYLYLMQMCYTNKIFYGLGQGVSGLGRWRLQADKFMNFAVTVPPLDEQMEIAEFLDDKINELDCLIQKKEQYLVEIENYKKSLIHEYVTGRKEVSQKYKV